MRDGYFRLVNTETGFGLHLVKPKEGGAAIKGMEVTAFLDREGISYQISALKAALEKPGDVTLELGKGSCPVVNENYSLLVSQDRMKVFVRFTPPSDTGKRVDINEVLADLRVKKIVVGINMSYIQEHFQSPGIYDRSFLVAQGQPPRQGRDASIEYFFDTDLTAQPQVREDGSVDYFQLNLIQHCKAGQKLAALHPADRGEDGRDVYGVRVRPREVQDKFFKFGNLVALSEDKLSLSAKVDGHVMLVDDAVVVSDVYCTENVDLSTGNINFSGSVQVNGNVMENMAISAGGNVIVNGVVEGARIEAGGNIIISQGMKGMVKGVLKAGGNVISKFLEYATVSAGGYVNTESILQGNVSANTDVIVTGKKGFIAGGHVQAGNLISVKNLGTDMGSSTVVEAGIPPELKAKFLELQRSIADIVRKIRNAQPILMNFAEKKKRGAHFTAKQLKYVAETDRKIKDLTAELNQKSEELKVIQEQMDCRKDARVEVSGLVCSGTTIIIGEASMILKGDFQYCRFENRDGEVKIVAYGR